MYTKLIIESIVKKKPIALDSISQDFIKFARTNKILYLLGYYDERIRMTNEWIMLNRRNVEQFKTITEIINLTNDFGIDTLIVKTLKPFKYAPDDIDILVFREHDYYELINLLVSQGYSLRKKGTSETTLRKIKNSVIIDLDIHMKLGAGPYEYIDKYYLWRRHIFKEINGIKVPTPNHVDELLITVAHAVMKEWRVLIADISHILYSDQQSIRRAQKQASSTGLLYALEFILNLTKKLLRLSSGKYVDMKTMCKSKGYLKVPLQVIVNTYVENVNYRLKKQGLKPLIELLKTPLFKGTATVLRYIGIEE